MLGQVKSLQHAIFDFMINVLTLVAKTNSTDPDQIASKEVFIILLFLWHTVKTGLE